ncbi:hypothetical protein DCCM_0258 [Desulfocucumis palustris]|uniref:Uncharacterized protein n=1 Tax=Desulfocucumis palustris TaxID=1898651 RepID=A0A2L2X7A5_9FIRM|nr:hypothetical protein DCCM_0258 [Desulfocucumis palustris]
MFIMRCAGLFIPGGRLSSKACPPPLSAPGGVYDGLQAGMLQRAADAFPWPGEKNARACRHN